jgi:heavy metal translocating P-type ATPase
MKFTIIHELPDRLRVNLIIPKGFSINMDGINGIQPPLIPPLLRGIKGVVSASFNNKTGNLLIRHNGDDVIKKEVLKAIESAPLSLCLKKAVDKGNPSHPPLEKGGEGGFERYLQAKKAVIGAGARLIISPLFPLPIRTAIALYGASPFFKKGIKALLNRRLNIDVLDAAAIGAAMGIGDYRTAGVISLLLKVGDYLEEWTKNKSRKMLTHAFQIGDEYAWVRNNGTEYMVKISELKQGDTVVVRTGSRIPADGVIIEGEAMVNQSSMTGESMPVMKRQGLTVYAGTVVEEGCLSIEASSIGGNTKIAKIVKIIEESGHLKADIQSYAERLADRLVPYTFLLSGLAYLITGNPLKAASVLLIDYSCAIKLSTPLSIMAGMINSAKRGAVVKGGKFIERLSNANVFVLDKTGTLTEASPSVLDVIPFSGYSKDYVLKHAACVEEHFPHPVATAIVKKARDEGLIHEEDHSEVDYIAAHGIASCIKGKRILVGSEHFIIEDEGINGSCCREIAGMAASKGHSILYVAIDGKLAGLIVIEDPLREDASNFIKGLKSSGINKIVMLTGDADTAARNVSTKLGIKEYYSQILPDKKTEIIKWLRNSGNVVAMVGDGINDSAALAHADVGISMKHGADIAKEACDILILGGSLMSIIEAKNISKRAMNTIRRNFKYIVGINSSLIFLSLIGLSTPAFSAFMHNASTVLSALNSIGLISDKDAASNPPLPPFAKELAIL